MRKNTFNQQKAITFKHFSNKPFALFMVIGRVVIVGVLSVATLTHAKAEGVSVRTDSIGGDTTGRPSARQLAEVSVTATRAPIDAARQSRTVRVLSAAEIAAAPVQSINDLLKYAAGVDVRQRGPIGAQTDVSIRGGNYEQITILLNGVNINDPQTGHNAFDFPCQPQDIERIEVLEGPAARVYGTSSMLGAINIITKSHGESGFQAGAEGGSFGYASVSGRIGYASPESWHQSFSASYTRSDGYSRSQTGRLNTDFSGTKAFYQGAYDNDFIDLKWHLGLSSKGFGSNTFYSSYSDEQYERTLKTFAALQGGNRKGRLHVSPQLYWNRYADRFELFHNDPDAYPYNYHLTNVLGGGVNSYFDWSDRQRTALSFELRQENLISGNLGEPRRHKRRIHGTDRYYDYGIDRTNIQATLEHNLLLKAFTLSGGITAVRNSWGDMGWKVYPGIDASYRFSPKMKIYGSYNASLRLPSVTELYYNSRGYNANKELKAEELAAFELGASYSPEGVKAQTSVFFNRYKNLIDWIIDENAASQQLTTTNFGHINAVGAQASVGFDLAKLLPSQGVLASLDIAYTYLDQRQKQYEGITSQYVLEYLRHKLVANLQLRPWRELTIDIAYRYQKRNGEYQTGFNEATNESITRRYSPYTIIDAKLTWNRRWYSIYLKINNLTAHRYVDFGRLKQPGLWLTGGVSVKI